MFHKYFLVIFSVEFDTLSVVHMRIHIGRCWSLFTCAHIFKLCFCCTLQDPNAMYGSEHKNIAPIMSNGHPQHTKKASLSDDKQRKEERNKHLRGDVSQYSEAKARREKRLRDTLLNREIMAKVGFRAWLNIDGFVSIVKS